jgi:putative addiction module component (TIGR02574 family)
MHRSVSDVFDAALALSEEDRAELAERLVASLGAEVDPEVEAAWATEIERRLQRIAAGQATSLTMDEALARLRQAARAADR